MLLIRLRHWASRVKRRKQRKKDMLNPLSCDLCHRKRPPRAQLPTVMAESLPPPPPRRLLSIIHTHKGSGWPDPPPSLFYKPIIRPGSFIQRRSWKWCFLHISCGKSDWGPTVLVLGTLQWQFTCDRLPMTGFHLEKKIILEIFSYNALVWEHFVIKMPIFCSLLSQFCCYCSEVLGLAK